MWKMLQANSPDDFVIGTGTDLSVKEFVQLAFDHAGLKWEDHVRFDEKYLRPTEVDSLVADASLAKSKLGWEASVSPADLAGIMVDQDAKSVGGHTVDKPVGKVWSEAVS
jgi:GDPmannose 4,6-dehydratase